MPITAPEKTKRRVDLTVLNVVFAEVGIRRWLPKTVCLINDSIESPFINYQNIKTIQQRGHTMYLHDFVYHCCQLDPHHYQNRPLRHLESPNLRGDVVD